MPVRTVATLTLLLVLGYGWRSGATEDAKPKLAVMPLKPLGGGLWVQQVEFRQAAVDWSITFE